jgi:hypothetical protein
MTQTCAWLSTGVETPDRSEGVTGNVGPVDGVRFGDLGVTAPLSVRFRGTISLTWQSPGRGWLGV